MALKAIIKSLDEVAESLRAEYKQDGEHFVLDVTPTNGFRLEDVESLRTALSKERQRANELNSTLSRFDGTTPEQFIEMRTRLDVLTKLDPSKEAERIAEEKLRNRETQLVELHTRELEAERTKNKQLEGTVTRLTQDTLLQNELSKQKIRPSTMELILEKAKKLTRLELSETGEPKVVVLDADGKTPRIIDGKGTPMTVDMLAVELRSKYPECFEGSGFSGGGMPPNNNSGGSGVKRSTMSDEEKTRYLATHSYQEYMKLPN